MSNVDAYKISQFCENHNLSRTTFYELKKIGKAPRMFKVGNTWRIAREAAEEWRRMMEKETIHG